MFPLKDHAMVDKVACWQRPPRKYTSDDVPWVGFFTFIFILHLAEMFLVDPGGRHDIRFVQIDVYTYKESKHHVT